MLLNISNHPSEHWSQKQFDNAILEYGCIIDIPFPEVQPECDSSMVSSISDSIISHISVYDIDDTAIHIMGEMTLTFSLVTKLKALGYTCVASTTLRNVTVNEGGDKVVHFDFVRFREY